ncbi:MAG: class I SAM-dependent methyltransferase [Deltaproteobacteria bacterium]|nr:class I SAM-dependent methyltransferase [Deltaproteobacteria bacterium]
MAQIAQSALAMAYMRSLDIKVSRDTLAQHLLTHEARALGDDWLSVYPGLARHGALRCRYIEDTAITYINRDVSQMINVAAGLNTFPYRHPDAARLTHYAEFDLPEMIEHKRGIIDRFAREGKIKQPLVKVDYVATDLTEDIALSFEKLGWDWSKPTIVVMEGISYYVPLASLQRVITTISGFLAPGSPVLFDYFRPEDRKTPLYQKIHQTIGLQKEPFLTFLDSAGVQALFDGSTIVSDRLITDIEKDYCPDRS